MPRSATPRANLLRTPTPEPNPSRINDIRRWMIAAATAPDAPVAGLALTITVSGQIEAAVRGIEPEHADLVLEQLEELCASLRAWAQANNQPQLPLCDVFPLRS